MKDYGAAFLGLVLTGIVVAIVGLVLMIPPDRTVLAERRPANLAPSYTLPADSSRPDTPATR
jgi:hypothetical protein